MLLLKKIPSIVFKENTRNLFPYVAVAFNKVDTFRLEQVGPDRLCAEWILKNGGAVAFTSFPGKFLADYNALPSENIKFKLKEIDATKASIMKIGFDHFIGCDKIDTIILNECKHLEDDGLVGLAHIKDSLEYLEVSSCWNIKDEGLMELKNLTNLKRLKITNMTFVKNLPNVISALKSSLPNCKFITDNNK